MGNLTLIGEVDHLAIEVRDSDMLYCACMHSDGRQYKPCEHVFKAMKRGLDAAVIGSNCTVPIFEEPVDGVHLSIEVSVRHHEARGGMQPFYLADERVGWVDEGEGRHQMRLLLLEYLRGQYIHAPACNHKNHTNYLMSASERDMCDLDSSQPTVIAGIAAVLQTGICWRCLHSANDDLVPSL